MIEDCQVFSSFYHDNDIKTIKNIENLRKKSFATEKNSCSNNRRRRDTIDCGFCQPLSFPTHTIVEKIHKTFIQVQSVEHFIIKQPRTFTQSLL